MRRFIFTLLPFLILPCFNLFSQYDTAFFNFKTKIIKAAANKVDSFIEKDSAKNVTHFQFNSFIGYRYTIGNPNSPVGFLLFRLDSFDCFPYKYPYEYVNGTKYELLDKSRFESFLDADEFDSLDLHKIHTQLRIFEDPIEGWRPVELYFFRNNAYYFRPQEKPDYKVEFVMPVYIFEDKNLTNTFLLKIQLKGIKATDIEIIDVKDVSFL